MHLKNSVYKFIDIDDKYNLDNLQNDELFCKYFNAFNDPYEGHFGVTTIWPCPYKETEKLKALITRLSPDSAKVNTATRDHMIAFIKANTHINKFTHDFLYSETQRYRVCSFTRRWKHILMWSHYSNGGRGAALVFDQNKLIDGGFAHEPGSHTDLDGLNFPLRFIEYKNAPPIINAVDVFESVKVNNPVFRERMNSEIFQKCFLTKFRTWKYEQESRLIIKLKEKIEERPILFKYPKDALTGVIIGNKCDDESYLSIANSVEDSVKILLACQSKSRYKYEITREFLAKDIKTGKVVINKELK